jgi:hypothetical protein
VCRGGFVQACGRICATTFVQLTNNGRARLFGADKGAILYATLGKRTIGAFSTTERTGLIWFTFNLFRARQPVIVAGFRLLSPSPAVLYVAPG